MYNDITSYKGYNINIKEMIPDNVEEIVVAIHGFAGDKESSAITALAESLNKIKIGVIALDLPAHGTSEVNGDYLTLENCINDINSIIEYSKSKYNLDKVSLFATSFGSYLTINILNRYGNKFNKVILRCPAIRMDEILVNEILDETIAEFEREGHTVAGYDREIKVNYTFYKELINNRVSNFKLVGDNILIIHGDEDTTAPFDDALDFAEDNNINISVIKGADHRFKKPGELEKVINLATKFIKK